MNGRAVSTDSHAITVTVNETQYQRTVESRLLLSDFLRHDLLLAGTHVGCEHGVCGACTVRIDGAPSRACLCLAVQADGRAVDTVEGLAGADGALSPLQAAFRKHHALQCGFCTPGLLMSLTALFDGDAAPTEAAIRDTVGGHLCRCTGYQHIVEAMLLAAERLRRPQP